MRSIVFSDMDDVVIIMTWKRMCVCTCVCLMIAFQLFYVGARGSDIFPVYGRATRLRVFRRREICGEKREITLSKLSDVRFANRKQNFSVTQHVFRFNFHLCNMLACVAVYMYNCSIRSVIYTCFLKMVRTRVNKGKCVDFCPRQNSLIGSKNFLY